MKISEANWGILLVANGGILSATYLTKRKKN